MQIDPAANPASLRLVGRVDGAAPVRPAAPTTPAQPVTPASAVRGDAPDSYNFESVYRANLPKIDLSSAQARLERLRHSLVAAKVDAPIHFDNSPVHRAANPYAKAYARLTPNPADVNAAATEMAE